MPILNVNPTRMELMRLKTRLKQVTRGHKLLKDKQDSLIREFMQIVHTVREMRREVEDELSRVQRMYLLGAAPIMPTVLDALMSRPELDTRVGMTIKNVMSVRVPEFQVRTEGNIFAYGFLSTNGILDIAFEKLQKLAPKLVELAALEKRAELMSSEIEKTRRRVNALEHRIIPDVKETIKFIRMKL